MVQMELSKILITETSDYQVIWLREKGGERVFPILIGIYEAAAIDRKVRDVQTPRPMTHDLLATVIQSLGSQLERVVVNALKDNTFFATLVLHLNGRTVTVDCRPSDAVAIAVRLGTPIFVEESVLDHVCNSAGDPENQEGGLPPEDPDFA